MSEKVSTSNIDHRKLVDKGSTNFKFGKWLSNPPPGEEVVISGMSGRLPESNNIYEFRENLFAKKDMVTADSRRWAMEHSEIPTRSAKIYNIDKLDAGYFGIHYRQAEIFDPMIRKFMETAVEAIMDAGINPSELEGTKTGVFVGACTSDMENPTLVNITEPQKFGITGYLRSFIAHRVSYYLKLKGPAYILDTACSSSFNALEHAFRAIRTGQCDNALVGGSNLNLHPCMTLQFFRLGVLSVDGTCKVFDQNANGYVRGETTACVFLQKAKNSKRIYGQIVHVKVNTDGFKNQGITFPSALMQQQLMTEIYEEAGIDPSDLSYLEAHGTGTQVGDPQEIEAIDCALAQRRKKPLLTGSVKCSVGHTEPSSGLCSLIKVLIAMETGLIPPNIHFRKIRKDLTGFEQGRLKVVTETSKLEGDIVGINNFGFGGSNCHVIVRRFHKKKNNGEQPDNDVPKLICVSGRTENSVLAILEDINQRPIDSEYVGLLHQLFKKSMSNHLYRGYTIISKTGPIKTSSKIMFEQTPLLYINFDKFDQCYKIVGRCFLNFPIFRTTLLRINDVLVNNKTNVIDIIHKNKNDFTDDILGAVAVQIGIVDILKALEITPTEIWGDTVGKLVCSYGDGTTTLKETIFAALKIAKESLEQLPKEQLLLKTHTKRHIRHFFNINENVDKPDRNEKLSFIELRKTPKNILTLNISDLEENCPVNFLKIVGSLYEQGYNPKLYKLYPEIEYPVHRGTPMISPLIKWNYDKSWYTFRFDGFTIKDSQQDIYDISLKEEEYKYIEGHVIDGRNLFPATGYLYLVWKTFARSRNLLETDFSVIFESCKFIRAVTMPKDGAVKLMVNIQHGSGNFEVHETNSLVVTGRICLQTDCHSDLPIFGIYEEEPVLGLEQDDIYKELSLRGYNYNGLFKGIIKCNHKASVGLVRWENNWVAFMDKMLQIKILQIDSRLLYVPVSIQRLSINPTEHLATVGNLNEEEPILPVHVCKENNTIKSGGIEITGLKANSISKRKQLQRPVLEKYEFVPNNFSLELAQSIRVNMQIILENSLENDVKAVEIIDDCSSTSEVLSPLINNALEDIPLIKTDLTISTKNKIEEVVGVKIEPVILSATSNLLLIIATKTLQHPFFLKTILSALCETGFVLTREDLDFCPENIEGIEILTQHTTKKEQLILFRKSKILGSTKFIEVSSQQFEWLPELQKALTTEKDIIVYSQKQQIEGITGLVNCIRREPGGEKIRCLFMIGGDAPQFDPNSSFYADQLCKNLAINVYNNFQWGTYRHLLLEDIKTTKSEHYYVNAISRGDLSSLKWIQGPLTLQTPLEKDQELVLVHYSAINFRDVMTASGRINADVITSDRIAQECVQGFEFSGLDRKKRRVMGMVDTGALSNLVVGDTNLLWTVPETWSLEDAATVPIVYGTVIYALLMRTKLRPSTTILIHSASGGVGIAALNVALHYECEVFVTVGTHEKKAFLKETFPQLKATHIGNSRDSSFEEMIKTETNGRGVDIVLNSLAEEKLIASVRCLARGGRFIEIGKFDLANNNSLGLLLMEKEASFHGIMLDNLFKEGVQVKLELVKQVSRGIEIGYVKPLPRTSFKRDEVEAAFRYMTTGKHIGKVLIKIREGEEATGSPNKWLTSILRFHGKFDKSYIVIGGLGGFGLELADWLVLRGVRKLILTTRTSVRTGYQNHRVGIWKSYGISVTILTINLSSKQNCLDLIRQANEIGAVDGIFNLAVVLQDALFIDQTEEKFKISLAPKAQATKFLDEVTRKFCPELRYFVVFSSVSCGRGNAGQTNYGMANSIMERICERRKQDGFPALAIQWGAVGDVGLVAKMQKDNKELVIGGTLQQKISSCLDVLDNFLQQNNPIVASMVVAEKLNKNQGCESAVDAVANILGIKDLKTVSTHLTLAELGLDSMMGVEVMQILEKNFEIYVSAKDVRTMTLASLNELESENRRNEPEKYTEKLKVGVNSILQYIPDSDLSDVPIIKLESNVKPDAEAPTVIVLPGIEGILKLLDPLTKNLNAHVLGVQYSYKNPKNTIQETAKAIELSMEHNTLSKKKPFYLICYSFGVIVGLELTSLLERKGFIGKIIAIDGSPEYTSSMIRQYMPGDSEAEFQTMLLYNVLATFLPTELIAQNKEKLMKCSTFEDRINYARTLIPSNISNVQKLEDQAAITLYKRFIATLNYRFKNNKIKSPVKLYKAKYPMVDKMIDDYKLSEFCEKPIAVTIIEGDHMTMLKQIDLVENINSNFN